MMVADAAYDVVADLEASARRIIDHCGLAWHPNCIAFHETRRPVRTASATQCVARFTERRKEGGGLTSGISVRCSLRDVAYPRSTVAGGPGHLRTRLT
jgi:hypothetical protein